MARRATVRRVLGLAASVCLAGCAVSDPTQYYALGRTAAISSTTGSSASRASASTRRSTVAGAGTVTIGVGPVIVPGYLDRIQIVTRTDTDQVEFSTFRRWAEPLEDGIAQTLAEEIADRVPTERIVAFPWRGRVARANSRRRRNGAHAQTNGRDGGREGPWLRANCCGHGPRTRRPRSGDGRRDPGDTAVRADQVSPHQSVFKYSCVFRVPGSQTRVKDWKSCAFSRAPARPSKPYGRQEPDLRVTAPAARPRLDSDRTRSLRPSHAPATSGGGAEARPVSLW